MSKRGIRVLENLDPEFAVMVAGTLDPEVALPLAVRFELDRQGLDADNQDDDETKAAREYAEEWMLTRVATGWWRTVPAPRDNPDGYSWMLWPAKEGDRGAFRAVEFQR